MSDKYIHIIDWNTFQHYKKRNPTWIKLHLSLLDNDDYAALSDKSKSLLTSLWLFSARKGHGTVPADTKYLKKKLPVSGRLDLQPLVDAGFIKIGCKESDSQRLANDASETLALDREREETEGEREAEKTTPTPDEQVAFKRLEKPFDDSPPVDIPTDNGELIQVLDAWAKKLGRPGRETLASRDVTTWSDALGAHGLTWCLLAIKTFDKAYAGAVVVEAENAKLSVSRAHEPSEADKQRTVKRDFERLCVQAGTAAGATTRVYAAGLDIVNKGIKDGTITIGGMTGDELLVYLAGPGKGK